MQNQNLGRLADSALLLVALIWGSGFIATQYTIDAGLSTAAIMTLRFALAGLLLVPLAVKRRRLFNRSTVLCGMGAGVLLFCGFYIQTFGQAHTTVSSCAFLTATNVVMVPFIVWIFTKKAPAIKTFVLAGTTLLGIGFLTLKPGEGFSLGLGEGAVLLCALVFASHIAYLGLKMPGKDAALMTFLQLATAGVLSTVSLLFSPLPTVQALAAGLPPALFLALFSTLVCYFLQTWAQQHTLPGKAGIILCCEGLFGSLFSVMLGMEPLTTALAVGGLVILTSVVCTEVDFGSLKKRRIQPDR